MANPVSALRLMRAGPDIPVELVIGGAFASAAAGALLVPRWFWVPLGILAVASAGVLVFRHIVTVCLIWLLLAGATLEMTLADLFGRGAFQSTIAVVKGAELGLALLCILRYGLRLDLFNPALAFVAMFATGLAHGLHPDLTRAESLRSFLGSVAPFAFGFSRLSPAWGRAMVRGTAWVPLLSVVGGLALDVAGLRPAFIDSGGQRVSAIRRSWPAFVWLRSMPA